MLKTLSKELGKQRENRNCKSNWYKTYRMIFKIFFKYILSILNSFPPAFLNLNITMLFFCLYTIYTLFQEVNSYLLSLGNLFFLRQNSWAQMPIKITRKIWTHGDRTLWLLKRPAPFHTQSLEAQTESTASPTNDGGQGLRLQKCPRWTKLHLMRLTTPCVVKMY